MFSGSNARIFMLILMWPVLAQANDLTPDRISAFMESTKALQSETRFLEALEQGRQARDMTNSVPGTMMISDILSALQSADVSADDSVAGDRPEAIVGEHGFADLTEWARTGDRILLALMSTRLEEAGPDLARELDQIEWTLETSTYFSAAQQARIAGMLNASRERIRQAGAVSQQDRDAIQPYLGELLGILDWQ